MRYRFGLTRFEYSAAETSDDGRQRSNPRRSIESPDPLTDDSASEYFVLCDPPYVLSERAHGKQYPCELTDDDHRRLLEALTRISASRAAVMLCGYESPIYAVLEQWRIIRHQVPTRGGLQNEALWMNYDRPGTLHDHRFVGDSSRDRERIRRRQKTWVAQLAAVGD